MSKTLDEKVAAKGAAAGSEGALQEQLAAMTEERDQFKAQAEAAADNEAAAVTAERERIASIMDSDEGKARPKMARQCALTTDMTADQANTFMAGCDPETDVPQSSAASEEAAQKVAAAITGPAAAGVPSQPASDDDKISAETQRMKSNTKDLKRG